ncbi:peroxin [Coniosporium tulheliwenetii]|uniref:Peroxin n=1 Tax=Coniosporium tulheliwenetii TaxID=3383036 RepID=A0ACC2Z6S3_9PEZI|nr:peroxin [Cladosporium sp. JES 115]
MIAATRRWFRRNRTNFVIGAGVLGAGYLAGQYVLGKVSEARQRMSDDRIARENLRRRFEQNQEDCTFTVLAILPTATENIIQELPVEQTLNELQKQKAERLARSVGASEAASDFPSAPTSVADDDGKSLKSFQSESYVHASQVADKSGGDGDSSSLASQPRPKKSKAQLWNEMKITSITRAFTLIYTLSLLTLLTRIQLNLLGRRNYLASVVSLASPPTQSSRISLENRDDDNFENAYGNDFETNRKYLSFSWWLLHRGCKDIMAKVTAAVEEVFGSLNPREDITLERLSELTLEVRKRVEEPTNGSPTSSPGRPRRLRSDRIRHGLSLRLSDPNPLPPPPPGRNLRPHRLPSFTHVLTHLLDAAFSLLIDTKMATTAFKIPPVSASAARVVEITGANEAKAKVANTLAVFCRQAHVIGSGEQNEYLAAMENVRELEAFAAVVYSSNFEFEAPETGEVNAMGSGIGAETVETAESTRPGTADTAVGEEVVGGEASLVGAESGFESAWGKALAKEDGKDV